MSISEADWRHLVGKVYVPDNENVESIAPGLPREKVVRDQDLPVNYRVLPPNSMMTLDFQPDRLNVRLDNKNVVTAVNLG